MTACGAVGALMVGGRVVGQLRCELDAGHEIGPFPKMLDRGSYYQPQPARVQMEATPHRVTLTWAPEHEVDLDLFDPDERFAVDVPADDPADR